jgi:hypothetical protein
VYDAVSGLHRAEGVPRRTAPSLNPSAQAKATALAYGWPAAGSAVLAMGVPAQACDAPSVAICPGPKPAILRGYAACAPVPKRHANPIDCGNWRERMAAPGWPGPCGQRRCRHRTPARSCRPASATCVRLARRTREKYASEGCEIGPCIPVGAQLQRAGGGPAFLVDTETFAAPHAPSRTCRSARRCA